jgi:hypothetical protein
MCFVRSWAGAVRQPVLPWCLALGVATGVMTGPLSAGTSRQMRLADEGPVLAGTGRASALASTSVTSAVFDPSWADDAPVYQADAMSIPLQQELRQRNFKREPRSGNFLAAKVLAKTPDEDLVAVSIGGKYMRDLRGRPVFLRRSIRTKLLAADAAMFEEKKQHIIVNYGFRSNAVQRELFEKLSGKGKVASPGESFHETGMALDVSNWRDAQRYMIDAGFVGGCYGIEEDLVHYSVSEVTKASNLDAFKRCTLKEIPQDILKGVKKIGAVTLGPFKRDKK